MKEEKVFFNSFVQKSTPSPMGEEGEEETTEETEEYNEEVNYNEEGELEA